jgi:hypothetical protein
MPIFNIRDNNVERAITVASKKAMQGNMVNVRCADARARY